MTMAYEPADLVEDGVGRRKPEPGTYRFSVVNAVEKTYNSGNQGVDLELAVDIDGTDIKVYTRMVYTPKALWRVKQCLTSLSMPFSPPPAVMDLIAKVGVAEFVTGEKGYLEVDKFLEARAGELAFAEPPPPAQAARSYPPSPAGRQVQYDDKVPF
jgi:hypothetical protein